MNNSLPKLLITGGDGQLAHALQQASRAAHFNLISLNRQTLDITDAAAITHSLDTIQPDLVINTAAYTAVDKAETETKLPLCINQLGSEYLAKACAERQIPLIHLSTDYVFDGSKGAPYTETDTPHPINHYGYSKWLGEEAIRKHCPEHIIMRVSGIFSAHGNNFYHTMLKLANNPNLRVVGDQITCPTYAGDIANALLTIAANPTHWGTYHYCSNPAVSWHAFAEAILGTTIPAITTAEYPTAAKRPIYSVLDCHKIAADYHIKQPSWQQALRELSS